MTESLVNRYRNIANFLNKPAVKEIIRKNPDANITCDYYKEKVIVNLTVYLKDNDYPVEDIASSIAGNCYFYSFFKYLLEIPKGSVALRINLTKELSVEDISLLRKLGKIKDELNSYVVCEI